MTLSQQINQTIKELQSMVVAKKYLEKLEQEINNNDFKLRVQKREMEAYDKDFRDLEDLPMLALFNKILGNTTEQLELERQSYLRSFLDYKELIKQRELLEFEYQLIVNKTKGLEVKKSELANLIKKREQEIATFDNEVQSKYLKLFEQLDHLRKPLFEVKEAFLVGVDCLTSVQTIIDHLNSAAEHRSWYSGKFPTDYKNEKSAIDDSVYEYQKLKIKLLKFEEELLDVYKQKKIKIHRQASPFETIIEGYYNYLINDWIVKKRITNAIHLMQALKDHLNQVLRSLESEESQLNEKINRLTEEKELWILNRREEN